MYPIIRIFDFDPQKVSSLPPLGRQEIHILRINCRQTSSDYIISVLSEKERSYSRQLASSDSRLHYILGHGMLRLSLSHYLNTPAEQLLFFCNEYGRPCLSHKACPDFNLSHSGNWVILAVSNYWQVGIDIEQVKNQSNLSRLAARYFHPEETLVYKKTETALQSLLFYHYWTSKEACLKGIGTGLRHTTASFSVSYSIHMPAEDIWDIHSPEAIFSNWKLTWLPVAEGYVCCLAFAPRL